MGSWNLSINGTGAHHNRDNPTDANKMFDKFVKDLVSAGHRISHASMTYGVRELTIVPDGDVYENKKRLDVDEKVGVVSG